MSIMWQYLNKTSAAEKALEDYGAMKDIIENTDERIKSIYEKMSGVGSPVMSDMPKGPHNPQATEDRYIKHIDEIDVAKERYRQALEYMDWMDPALASLNDDERAVLEMYYWSSYRQRGGAIRSIMDYFQIEQSSAYNKKNRALAKLTLLLYGK